MVIKIPRRTKVFSFLRKALELVERLNHERLGGEGKVLGVRRGIESKEYAIYFEVPREVYLDFDKTDEIGVEVLKLSDLLGVPIFLYFVSRKGQS